MTLMHEVERLPRCQFVQESLNGFTLRVFDQGQAEIRSSVDELLAKLKGVLEDDVQINVSIEKTAHVKAKFRSMISTLSPSTDKRSTNPY